MSSTKTKFTRNPNLSRYDKDACRVIKHAISKGWVGRDSNKGHMILHAPDGKTTTSVQRDLSGPHARENSWAPIRAWEKRVALPLPKDGDGNVVLKCDHCAFDAENKMALVSHMTIKHSEPRICPICNDAFGTQANYIVHINKTHTEVSKEQSDSVEAVVKDELETPGEATLTALAFPDAADYDNWTTDQLVHAMKQMPLIAQALTDRLSGQFAKIELVREALSL